jgi:hypothetical protein
LPLPDEAIAPAGPPPSSPCLLMISLGKLSLGAGAGVLASVLFVGSSGLVAGSVGLGATVADFSGGFVILIGSVVDFVLGGFVSGAAGLRGSGSNSGASIKRTGK